MNITEIPSTFRPEKLNQKTVTNGQQGLGLELQIIHRAKRFRNWTCSVADHRDTIASKRRAEPKHAKEPNSIMDSNPIATPIFESQALRRNLRDIVRRPLGSGSGVSISYRR